MFCTFAHQNSSLPWEKYLGDLVILSSMLSYHRLRLIAMFVQLGHGKLIAGRNHDISAEDLCAKFTMRKWWCQKSAKFLVSAAEDKNKHFQGWCLWNLSTWKTERCTAMYLQPSGGTLSKSSLTWSKLSRYGREDLELLGLTFTKDLFLASSQVERYLSCVWRVRENLLPPDLPPLGDWPGEQATPHQTPGETDQKAGW